MKWKSLLVYQNKRYYFMKEESLLNLVEMIMVYRNYNEKDVQLLTMIKFFRSLEISIDDIRLIISHQLSFQDCLESQQVYMNQNLADFQQVKSTIDFYG